MDCPVLSVSCKCPSTAEAVTLIVPVELMSWMTSSMFWAFERLTTAEAPLRSVMRISPAVNPMPPLMLLKLAPVVTVGP